MSQDCTPSKCSGCGSDCASRMAPQDLHEQPHELSHIKKVIAVISGKGGVGKSLVTSLLAVAAAREGKRVAVMDADITGPSIPTAFGIHDKAVANEFGLLPVVTNNGTAVMSVNLLLENETDPVVWRGPVISGVVKQFWTEVVWGDVDYMFVDMPPGTGDAPLTVVQSLPLDGIIVVTSPQDLVSMIVAKAVKMAQLMNVPILGIVENMSYFQCPDCGKQHHIYGESHIEEIAKEYGIPATASLPIDPALAKACDNGLIEDIDSYFISEIKKFIV